ncbi:MAG: hypothetical protein QOJ98_787 [Acidobacteriota bacterium]|jgi:hypothetical protein|nr:hypothetical protein [Acidobacteriota bacterium]
MTSAAIDDAVTTRGSATALDTRRIVGTWRCTNRETKGIPRFTMRAAGGRLYVNVISLRDGQDFEWGEREVTPYAHEFGSREVFAFTADYDFGFQRIHVQALPRRGVMVFGTLIEFTDDSGRIGGFVREFYYRDRS